VNDNEALLKRQCREILERERERKVTWIRELKLILENAVKISSEMLFFASFYYFSI
jgi:hypothetical protein